MSALYWRRDFLSNFLPFVEIIFENIEIHIGTEI